TGNSGRTESATRALVRQQRSFLHHSHKNGAAGQAAAAGECGREGSEYAAGQAARLATLSEFVVVSVRLILYGVRTVDAIPRQGRWSYMILRAGCLPCTYSASCSLSCLSAPWSASSPP